DRICVRNYTWIGSQDPADVGPDLYFTRSDQGAEQRCGVVRTSASERGCCAFSGRTDKPTQDGNDSVFENRNQFILRVSQTLCDQWSRAGVFIIRDNATTCIDLLRFDF